MSSAEASAGSDGFTLYERVQALDKRLDDLMEMVRLKYLVDRQGGWDSTAEWGDTLSLGQLPSSWWSLSGRRRRDTPLIWLAYQALADWLKERLVVLDTVLRIRVHWCRCCWVRIQSSKFWLAEGEIWMKKEWKKCVSVCTWEAGTCRGKKGKRRRNIILCLHKYRNNLEQYWGISFLVQVNSNALAWQGYSSTSLSLGCWTNAQMRPV